MRFTYAEAMTQASFYAPLAQASEAAGYITGASFDINGGDLMM